MHVIAAAAVTVAMPLYTDVHEIAGGVTAAHVAKAHEADVSIQGAHDVNYLGYWVNEGEGEIFCLVEAPSADAANAVHQEAPGLDADAVYQVCERS